MDKLSFEERARRFVSFEEDIIFLERNKDKQKENEEERISVKKSKDKEETNNNK